MNRLSHVPSSIHRNADAANIAVRCNPRPEALASNMSGSPGEPASLHTERTTWRETTVPALARSCPTARQQFRPGSLGAASIDASLARGIRRAYLESLDRAWDDWRNAHAASRARIPFVQMPNAKAFEKLCTREESVLRRFLPVDQFKISTGRKRLWACLSLVRERPVVGGNCGMTPAGIGRVTARLISFPGGFAQTRLQIRFSGHAIDRVVQRAKVVNLPLLPSALEAIHASFSGALLWSIAALAVLARLRHDPTDPLCIPLPVEHGIFLATLDETGELVVKTYVPRDQLWEEESYALSKFEYLGDERASLFAAELLCPSLFANSATMAWAEAMREAWRELHWLLRTKSDRPGLLAEAWCSV